MRCEAPGRRQCAKGAQVDLLRALGISIQLLTLDLVIMGFLDWIRDSEDCVENEENTAFDMTPLTDRFSFPRKSLLLHATLQTCRSPSIPSSQPARWFKFGLNKSPETSPPPGPGV